MPALKILIIEDVILTALSLRNALEKYGYEITSIAKNLGEARESIEENEPDVAVVDIMLEGSPENGVEIVRELLSVRRIPIIYLTANSEIEQFQLAQTTYPAAYLVKPYKVSDVVFNIELAYHNFASNGPVISPPKNLMLPTNGGLELVEISEIAYLRAGGAYTDVVMVNNIRYLVSVGIGQLEQYFRKPAFLRVSRSFVVNIDHIIRIKDGELMVKGHDIKIPVGDAVRKELLGLFTVIKTRQSK